MSETTRGYVKIHLVDGTTIHGLAADLTKESVAQMESFLGDTLAKGPDEGWQVNTITSAATWAIVPRSSVLWIELVLENGRDFLS